MTFVAGRSLRLELGCSLPLGIRPEALLRRRRESWRRGWWHEALWELRFGLCFWGSRRCCASCCRCLSRLSHRRIGARGWLVAAHDDARLRPHDQRSAEAPWPIPRCVQFVSSCGPCAFVFGARGGSGSLASTGIVNGLLASGVLAAETWPRSIALSSFTTSRAFAGRSSGSLLAAGRSRSDKASRPLDSRHKLGEAYRPQAVKFQ